MAARLTILTHKIAIQVHQVAGSCIICSPRSRRPVRKLSDTPSYDILSLINSRPATAGLILLRTKSHSLGDGCDFHIHRKMYEYSRLHADYYPCPV